MHLSNHVTISCSYRVLARIIHEKHANNVFWVSGFEVAIISNMEWHSKDCEGLGSGFVVGCKAENDYKIRHLD